jgi:hypothetical protein
MSVIKVNNITNRDGTSGPVIAGITTVSSTSHMVVPTGRTGQRYVDDGENIVRSGLVLYLDAKHSYPGLDGVNPDIYNWYDLSGNENNGELKNGVSYSTSDGGSLVFDGSNDYIDNTFSFSSRPFSINCWIYFNSLTGWQTIIGQDTSQSTLSGAIYFQKTSDNFAQSTPRPANTFNTSISTTSNTTIDCLDTSTVSANTWYNFCASVSTTDIKLYRNGSLVQTTVNSDALATPTGTIKIGAGYYNNTLVDYANVRIPITQIYNRALTAAEVSQNFNAVRSRFGL